MCGYVSVMQVKPVFRSKLDDESRRVLPSLHQERTIVRARVVSHTLAVKLRFRLVIKVGSEKRIVFDPFSLDLANECLWRGSQVIKLRPKAFAVLNHLLWRPGQLVTKKELLNNVWPETFVGDAVLKVA